MKIIDCKGLKCPKPVILAKKELEGMTSGEIEVIVDNEAAKENLIKLSKSQGCTAVVTNLDGNFSVKIIRNESCSVMDLAEIKNDGDLTIVVSTDRLGLGSDELGDVLMKAYIYALSESDIKPTTLIFLNGGVKLTCDGSVVLDSLRSLSDNGVEILSCGTCLDYYKLKEKLIVGSISNMYTIVEKMNGAGKTIKI